MNYREIEEKLLKLKSETESADRKAWMERAGNFFSRYNKVRDPEAIDQRKFLAMNRGRLTPEDSKNLFEIEKAVDHAERELDRVLTKYQPKGAEAERLQQEALAHVLKAVESLKVKELSQLYSKVVELERKKGTTLDKLYELEKAKLEADSLDETAFRKKAVDIKNGSKYSPEQALALKAKCADGKLRKSLEEAFQEVPHYLSGEGFPILKRIRELTILDRGEYVVKITEGDQIIEERISPASWLLSSEVKQKEPEVIFK